MVCGNVVPHEKQVCESAPLMHQSETIILTSFCCEVIPLSMLDKWDYVLRRLFVLRSTPLKKAMLYVHLMDLYIPAI